MNKKLHFQGAVLLAGMAASALTPMAAWSDEFKQSAVGRTRGGNCRVGRSDPGPSNMGSLLGYLEETSHCSSRLPSRRACAGSPSHPEFRFQDCGTGEKRAQEVELPSLKSMYWRHRSVGLKFR